MLDKFYCTLLNSNMYDPSANYPTLHYALCMEAVFIILFPFVVGVCDHFLGAAAPCAHVGTYSRGHQVFIRAAGDWTVCKHAVNISIHYQIVL